MWQKIVRESGISLWAWANTFNLAFPQKNKMFLLNLKPVSPPFYLQFLFALFVLSSPLWSQTPILYNASFEEGEKDPLDWHLSAPKTGRWLGPDEGFYKRAVSIKGNGTDTSYWHSDPISFIPGQTYALTFYARSLGSKHGSAISGPRFCNQDLGEVPTQWTQYRSIFTTPTQSDRGLSFLRFGQWKVNGEIAFDQVAISLVHPIYTQDNTLLLGEGESIRKGHYSFNAPLGGPSANHSRPLSAHSSNFNTNRWVFGPGHFVEYHHVIEGHQQQTASVEIAVGHYESGRLIVEVSKDRKHYVQLGHIETTQSTTFAIPSQILPASELWIRLRSSFTKGGSPGAFQIVTYVYSARLDGNPPDLHGKTYFAELKQNFRKAEVQIISLGQLRPGRPDSVTLSIRSRLKRSLSLKPSLTILGQGKTVSSTTSSVRIDSGENRLSLPYTILDIGSHILQIGWNDPVPYNAQVDVQIPALYAAQPGHLLPMQLAGTALWHIDSGWKVDRNRPMPTGESTGLFLSAAGGEREAIQLVLTPRKNLKSLTLRNTTLSNAVDDTLERGAIEIFQVGYVPITQPSDSLGAAALWPDPLLPIEGPIDLKRGINHPLWIRVNIPEGTPPGLYEGAIMIAEGGREISVPLKVEVYGFSLPRQMSCSTAFGFSFSNVIRYHNLSDIEDKRRVLDLYLENFSAHRISPYDPAPLDPLRVSWNHTVPKFDWSAWDKSMTKAIEQYGFNSFRLDVSGLGSGDYTRQIPPQLNGFIKGDPRYRISLQRYLGEIERHLEEKQWLDEAYIYLFDEPRTADYPFVNREYSKLAQYAPRLRRMLTEQVEDALQGGPTIWCPLTSRFQPHHSAERRAEGETYWWYICTQPKAPYAGLFIDRAGLGLRTWLWQTWQNGIEGILIWQSNYWHSGAAYTETKQNPYLDPMSWVSKHSAPEGTRRPWGNGDGRFIYPPLESFTDSSTPIIKGPIDSQRWEMLRDGIEDYEYFTIMSELLNNRTGLSPAERNRYTSLLKVPDRISTSLRQFNPDPSPLRQHRHALARAIESLQSEHTE